MSVIRNILALVGLLSLILFAIAAYKIESVVERIETFDENAIDIYTDFVRKVYESSSAIDAMVYKVPVSAGLTADDVDILIRSNADQLNIKNVGELFLSKEVTAITGKRFRYIKIYMLCDAMTAASIVNYNDAFTSILPCRLSLVEDQQGKLWIYTLDLDLMIQGGKPMPPALKTEAIKVRDTLQKIMHKSAEGDF